jgi:hypothetical protein
LYNEQGIIPINLSVPNQRDFLVNFTNNDESVNTFTDNLALVRSIRDIPNGDYTEDDKLVVFAASVSGLIENGKPRHINDIRDDGNGLVNGDPKKFDEDFDKVVKNAKKPENADFYLRYCVVNRYAEFYATYDKDNNEHHDKWHTIKPKFVR